MIKFYQLTLFLIFLLPAQMVWANHIGHPESPVQEEPGGAKKPAEIAEPEKPAEPAAPDKSSQEQLFSIGINVIPKEQNDDISGIPVEDKIDKSAFAYQINYAFPSKKKIAFSSLNVQEYISLRFLKFVATGEDEEFPDYLWAESFQALAVIYGQRYFIQKNFQGFAFGWYGGGAIVHTEGYDYSATGSFPDEEYEEDLLLPLIAFEFLYKFSLFHVYIEPNVLIGINSRDFGFEILPSLVIGATF